MWHCLQAPTKWISLHFILAYFLAREEAFSRHCDFCCRLWVLFLLISALDHTSSPLLSVCIDNFALSLSWLSLWFWACHPYLDFQMTKLWQLFHGEESLVEEAFLHNILCNNHMCNRFLERGFSFHFWINNIVMKKTSISWIHSWLITFLQTFIINQCHNLFEQIWQARIIIQ